MSVKYKTGDDQLAHFISFSVIEWIDVFTRNEYKDILVESLQYCIREKGMNLYGWVIMSNHMHLIMSAKSGNCISNILRDFKKFTSKQVVKAIKENSRESRKDWLIYMFERAETPFVRELYMNRITIFIVVLLIIIQTSRVNFRLSIYNANTGRRPASLIDTSDPAEHLRQLRIA